MLKLLTLASEVADLSVDKERKAFIGAVAIRKDGIIVHARNGGIPHASTRNPKVHAEWRVLRKAGYGASVYVARIKRDGTLGLSKPCDHCMAALRARGVDVVYYTISNDDWEACKP